MNETMMTIVGNVCDEPTMRLTKSGHAVTNLRVASTPRRYDRESGNWVDCPTLFVDVTCWRQLGENVAESVHKGQPVVVTGRYTSHTYEVGEQLRYAQVLEASAVGHDLSRGTCEFRKAVRGAITHVRADENGVPVDESGRWLGALDAPFAGSTAGPAGGDAAGPELAAVG